jgi:uncharacterized protein (UPF0212 family)
MGMMAVTCGRYPVDGHAIRSVGESRKQYCYPCALVRTPMTNYLVAMEAAWLVRDVEAIDDAIGVAVSEAGKRLNDADMDYVEVEVGATPCPACGEAFDSAFIAADTALVGLLLEMEVFNADSTEHAARIAKSEVGGALRDVPLSVIETVETGGDDESD